MKDIAAIVVTYNRKKLLLENIESLLKQTVNNRLDIVIIDNNSTDGTFETIKKYIDDKKIIYVNTGNNLGGAGGFQYGIKYAAKKKYKFLWIMDDDCIPLDNTLEQFLYYDKRMKKQYGFFSSKVLWKDNNICKMNVQRKTVFKNVKDFKTEVVSIKMASFVSLFVPIEVVKDVGLPIKEFFIWTDDWEYTRRISKKYKCYLLNTSVVIHKSVSNFGANIAIDKFEKLDRYKYLYRNDVYLYRREGLKGILYEIIRLSSHILRVLFKAKDYKIKRIKYIIKGTLKGLSFNPEIQYVKD